MMKTFIRSTLFAFLLFFPLTFVISNPHSKDKPMKIAVSKATKNYINWLKKVDSAVIFINMYELDLDKAIKELKDCSGLLVTGGEDVQPGYYGKADEKGLCGNMDPKRDTLEIALIKKAIEIKMPVLGICRGQQIINVALGGSLIVDIPSLFKSGFTNQKSLSTIQDPSAGIRHQCEDYLKCFHSIQIAPNSQLQKIAGCDTGFVTSNHHQAIDRLASGLKTNAYSKDGIIEGIEWDHPEGKSFLLAVQWHPERMDISNSCSGRVLNEFYLQASKYYQKH